MDVGGLILDRKLTLSLDARVGIVRQRLVEHLNRPRVPSQRLHRSFEVRWTCGLDFELRW